MRSASEDLELGGVDPTAERVGIVVDIKTIPEKDVFVAASLLDMFILWFVRCLMGNKTVRTYIREIGGFEDDATAYGER